MLLYYERRTHFLPEEFVPVGQGYSNNKMKMTILRKVAQVLFSFWELGELLEM